MLHYLPVRSNAKIGSTDSDEIDQRSGQLTDRKCPS